MMRSQTFAITMAVCLVAAAGSSRAQTPPGGWVVLPVDEYRTLRTRAGQSPPAAAVADAVLTRLDYTLRVEGDVVLGRAALVVDVLGAGWATLPLPVGLAVREARLDGQPFVIDPGPPAVVHLSRVGRATLELEVVFTPSTAAGVETIAVPASTAAVTRVVLTVPGTTHVVSATGGVVLDRVAGNASTAWTVHGRSATPLALSWARRRDDPRAGEPLRLRTRIDATAGLRDTLLQVATTVELEVLQGVTRELVLAVPPDVTVTAVSGTLVDDWRVEGGQLRVTFLEAVSSTTTCVVRSESRLPAAADVALPMLRVPAAEREGGRISVDVGGEAEVVGMDVAGLETLDGPSAAASPRLRAFQLTPLPGTAERRLSLRIARYAPEAVPVATIDEARYRVLASASGALLVEAQYLVRNNQRSALTLTLPAGARLWQARVGGHRQRPGAVDGARVLLPLDRAPAGGEPTAVVVSIVYLDRQAAWSGDQPVRLVLPALDLPVARTGLLLHHPPSLRLEVGAGPLRLTDDLGPFAAPMTSPRPPSLAPAVDDQRSGATADVTALIARLRREQATPAAAPQHEWFAFPTVGPALFLRSELTPEAEPLALDLVLHPSR